MVRNRENFDKTIVARGSIRSLLDKVNKVPHKGVNIRLFTVDGQAPEEEKQTVMTFLSNTVTPVRKERKDKEDIEKLIGLALDKVLIGDRVRSAADRRRTDLGEEDNKEIIETDPKRLEGTDLDYLVKRVSVDKSKDKLGRLEF